VKPATGTGECVTVRQELGVYVLGAVGPADRSVVTRHLACCPRCREELAGLAGLPGLLRMVPEAALLGGQDAADCAMGAVAPEQLLSALPDRTTRPRRHRGWVLTAAAAVLIGGTAAGWGLQALRPAAQPPPPALPRWAATARGFSPQTRAGATVRYSTRAWGTELEVQVTGVPAGTTCQFWVTTTAGQDVPAAAWAITAARQHAWYPASAPVRASGLRSFEVTTAGRILVTVQARRAAISRTRV